ncbi:hypothetical protein G9A89_009022 [Geosiphon pyriformis]|nr:hypothetical protein G9A89_009022 [Geosiphon pyriformis]
MAIQKGKANGTMIHVSLVTNNYSMKECETTFLGKEEHAMLRANIQSSSVTGYSHDKNEIWQMANTKIKGTTLSKILKIKNNPPKPVNIVLISNPDTFLDLEAGPKEFHEHYQNLAPTREEQEQWLEEINIQLCDHCLILCDFQYCNECDLIYNPPICMIYTIPKKEEPISSCALELESVFNSNSNSNNNNNENNGSSSTPISNKNYNNLNFDSYPETFIALFDLTKEQELKWFSNNGKSIMPECAHDTDARFDLRYPEKDSIKLEPHSCTCINLKIALKIPATTMVQLASRSSLAKKGINIREKIIDTEYIRNIIAMLQNNSEKAYIIEPNEKIAQTIFLSLVKIAQLVLVENKEELGITARGIQRFRLMGRIDIPVNMAEEKVIDKRVIILICQTIFIPPYDQYMLVIKRKVKNQAQLFKAEATICELKEIGLMNFYISAKSPKNIKIPIYNTTENVIKIPKRTIIGYLITEVGNQPPNHIPNFSQLCRYVDITSQTIYRRSECYLLQPEQLEQINMGNLNLLQQMQLKILLSNFNDIFASKNEFGCTNII